MKKRILKIDKKLKKFVIMEDIYPSEHRYQFWFEGGYLAKVYPNHKGDLLWNIDLRYCPSSRPVGRDIGCLLFMDNNQVNEFLCLLRDGKIRTSANTIYGEHEEK